MMRRATDLGGMPVARSGGMARRGPDRRALGERLDEGFAHLASGVADIAGTPWATAAVVAMILVWLVLGPVTGFSETWQLWANTVTTLVTVVMVFVIQNTMNRDSEAMHIKLDELIRATKQAENELIGIEHEGKAALDRAREEMEEFASEPKDPRQQRGTPGNGRSRETKAERA
jgi:low affinity Fe/Cu permease